MNTNSVDSACQQIDVAWRTFATSGAGDSGSRDIFYAGYLAGLNAASARLEQAGTEDSDTTPTRLDQYG